MNINCYIYISDTVHLNITENPLSSLNLSTTTPDDKRSIKLTMNPLEDLVNKLTFNISVEKATVSVLLIVSLVSLCLSVCKAPTTEWYQTFSLITILITILTITNILTDIFTFNTILISTY